MSLNLTENKLYAELTKADQASLRKISKPLALTTRQTLGAQGEPQRQVYFLTGASVALVVREKDKPRLALGVVGHEGAVGVQFALGLDAGIFSFVVQTPGNAWCVDGDALAQLVRLRPPLLQTFSKYLWRLTQEIASFAAFAQVNEVKPRLARWILASFSRSESDELTLTQTHLAEMLGVRRASITNAAIELKTEGLIDYRRGKLSILDAEGLQAVAERYTR